MFKNCKMCAMWQFTITGFAFSSHGLPNHMKEEDVKAKSQA